MPFSIELEAREDGTLVTLDHHGWERMNDPELAGWLYRSFASGWSADDELADLARYLEQKDAQP